MSNPSLLTLYVKDPNGAATPVMVDSSAPVFTQQPVKVQLTVDCRQILPPGWPAPPSETGVTPVAWYDHVIPAGTVMVHFKAVAAALIAAGAATAV